MADVICSRCGGTVRDRWDLGRHGARKCEEEKPPAKPISFADIKSFEVVSEPGEVRYHLTIDGALRIYVGKGLSQAPSSTSSAHIQPGYTTFIIREVP